MRIPVTIVLLLCLADVFAARRPPSFAGDPAIAYQVGTNVAVVDESGANVRVLTSDGLNRTPSWSPDGAWIVFARREQLKGRTVQGIYVMKKDGTTRCRVVNVTATDGAMFLHPVWSPVPVGGKYWIVYFDAAAGDQPHNLFAVEAPALVTNPSAGCTTKASGHLLTPNTESDAETRPSWSPTADRITAQVSHSAGIDIVTYSFAVVNGVPELSNRTVITAAGGLAGVYLPVFPKWANTQERVFVYAPYAGRFGGTDVWWADLASNGNFNITAALGADLDQFEATPSPDDQQITFWGYVEGNLNPGIYKVNVDGSAPQLLVGGTSLRHANWRRCNRNASDAVPDCR